MFNTETSGPVRSSERLRCVEIRKPQSLNEAIDVFNPF